MKLSEDIRKEIWQMAFDPESVCYIEKHDGEGFKVEEIDGDYCHLCATEKARELDKEDGDKYYHQVYEETSPESDHFSHCTECGYWHYMQRNSSMKPDTLEERKKKLQLVADQALMTKHYFETADIQEINEHVKTYLYPCLMQYGMKTLQMGERKSMDTAEEAVGYFYECIMNGQCIYNYERFCKKIMTDIKKKGKYGEYWHRLVKPVKIDVKQLNLDCLWERYKVTQLRK